MREYKRLQRSNDQSPGHAMSRAYLETLADLPWSALASQRVAPPADNVSTSADATEAAEDHDSTDATSSSSPDIAEDEDETAAVPVGIPSTSAGECDSRSG